MTILDPFQIFGSVSDRVCDLEGVFNQSFVFSFVKLKCGEERWPQIL
jgi:hypothetical protein